jgi:hypothetical protein
MTTLRQAAQQALEALQNEYDTDSWKIANAAQILDETLKQPEQEPVAWIGCGECDCAFSCFDGAVKCIRLPAQRKPLTASEILNMMPSSIPAEHDGALMEFARDIEAALGIKEGA